MWTINVFNPNLHSSVASKLFIPADDVVFSAALKRAQTVHVGKETFVRCAHVAEYDKTGNTLIFPMTLLEATYVEAKYPEFVEEGLMGKWQLSKTNNTLRLKFLSSYSQPNEFLEDVLGPENPEWIKQSYNCVKH